MEKLDPIRKASKRCKAFPTKKTVYVNIPIEQKQNLFYKKYFEIRSKK